MPRRLGPCTVVAIDPGTTTGIVVVSMDPRWLKGNGPAAYEGLGAAVRHKSAYQIGREPKMFSEESAKSRTVTAAEIDGFVMPVLAHGQPLLEDNHEDFDGRGRKTEAFYGILDGEFSATVGRGDLSVVDAGEMLQVRQVAGLLFNFAEAALVIEDFQLRATVSTARETTSPDRLRLAIATEEAMHGEGRVPFLQSPADAKRTVTDDRLRRANLFFKGMPHATDAARHAALFFRRCRTDEALRAQAFPRHFSADWEA